jgi:hypothetical protein
LYCGSVPCKIALEKFMIKACTYYLIYEERKKYFKSNFFDKSNSEWIGLNVKEEKFIASHHLIWL